MIYQVELIVKIYKKAEISHLAEILHLLIKSKNYLIMAELSHSPDEIKA